MAIKEIVDRVEKLEYRQIQSEQALGDIQKRLDKAFPKPKPWYTNITGWVMLIICGGLIGYLIWEMYMLATGHNVVLPFFLKWLGE